MFPAVNNNADDDEGWSNLLQTMTLLLLLIIWYSYDADSGVGNSGTDSLTLVWII